MKPRADTTWKPPGSSADRPLHESLLAPSLRSASEPPGGAGGLPCFSLTSCSAHRRDGELAGLSEIVGVHSPNSPKDSPSGVYVRGAVCGRPSAGAADAAAGGGLHVRSSDIVGAQVKLIFPVPTYGPFHTRVLTFLLLRIRALLVLA